MQKVKETKDNLNIKYKDKLTSFVNEQKSIYPKINVKNGETRLEEIYNFLISEQKYNKDEIKTKTWLKYIIILKIIIYPN